jgi:hypothetical protein
MSYKTKTNFEEIDILVVCRVARQTVHAFRHTLCHSAKTNAARHITWCVTVFLRATYVHSISVVCK